MAGSWSLNFCDFFEIEHVNTGLDHVSIKDLDFFGVFDLTRFWFDGKEVSSAVVLPVDEE